MSHGSQIGYSESGETFSISRPGMRIIFHAAKDTPEDVLEKTADLLAAMKSGRSDDDFGGESDKI